MFAVVRARCLVLAVCLLVIAGWACSSTPDSRTRPSVSPLSRIELAAQDVRGISGLARASDGTLWAVGERDHVLLAMSAADGRTFSRRAVDGVDGGIELGATDAQVARRLDFPVTSGSGKLSALDCRADGDRLDVLAIERYFRVARVLRFSVPRTGQPGVIVPTIALDLAPHKSEEENFEGIVWLGDGSVALILDNDSGSISGPNMLIHASF